MGDDGRVGTSSPDSGRQPGERASFRPMRTEGLRGSLPPSLPSLDGPCRQGVSGASPGVFSGPSTGWTVSPRVTPSSGPVPGPPVYVRCVGTGRTDGERRVGAPWGSGVGGASGRRVSRRTGLSGPVTSSGRRGRTPLLSAAVCWTRDGSLRGPPVHRGPTPPPSETEVGTGTESDRHTGDRPQTEGTPEPEGSGFLLRRTY